MSSQAFLVVVAAHASQFDGDCCRVELQLLQKESRDLGVCEAFAQQIESMICDPQSSTRSIIHYFVPVGSIVTATQSAKLSTRTKIVIVHSEVCSSYC